MINCENYFIKYSDSPHWWRWPQDGEMKVYNYLGGWHEIDENSERWMNAKCIRTVDTWHQLYELTGYCPFELEVGEVGSELWVSPEGGCFSCLDYGHELGAEYLLDIIYDRNCENDYIACAGDELIEMGWIKLTTNKFMFDSYATCGFYSNLTWRQQCKMIQWNDEFEMEAEAYGIF